MIPNIILKQLYKKGSLRKTPDGVAFTICNKISKADVNKVISVTINEKEISAKNILLFPQRMESLSASDVSDVNQLVLGLNKEIDILLEGFTLSEAKHNITFSIEVDGPGRLDIKIKDSLSHSPSPSLKARETNENKNTIAATRKADPVKIAFIGAGSMTFTRTLINDILATPGLEKGTFALIDIDEKRLNLIYRISKKYIEQSGKDWSVKASTDRLELLPGSDFIISTIEVSGVRNVLHDYEIPLKYGVDQCIGDTIGPGGIFKMLRTGPAWMAIVKDIERLAPEAIVINYTNPMSALTLLGMRSSSCQLVGLCHSVQGTSQQLALYAGVPYKEMKWQCAGINHMAWFTELSHNGEDLYPVLLEKLKDPELYAADPVRFEMMKHFGAFVTESSGHFSEYLPYFRKNKAALEKFTGEGHLGESGYYAKTWPKNREDAEALIKRQLESNSKFVIERSGEYASKIIEATIFNVPFVIHGNVINNGAIVNLPENACVEIPILIDRNGLQPVYFGRLPEQMAALNRTHISVHNLMVQAVIDKDKQAALHALMLDPLTAAVCTPDQISDMFEEMWEAQKEDLQYYQ